MTDPKERHPVDSGLLYTGANSASFAVRTNPVKEKKEDNKRKHQELKPAGQIVIDEINKELTDLMFGPYPNEDSMTDEEFRVERRARRLTVEKITVIKTRLTNILRKNKL